MQNILHKLVTVLQLTFMSTLLLSVLALVATRDLFFAYVLIAHGIVAIAVVVACALVILCAALYTFYEDAICTLLNK